MTSPSLKNILHQFLTGSSNLFYPVIETKILQLNPLQISDDLQRYIDISSMQEAILSQIDDTPGANYKLILNEWKFVFKKVPNTHEFYFDIVSNNYRVIKEQKVIELDEYPTKMVDDEQIRYNFEFRKRKELEEIIKLNMRVKKSSPAKPTQKPLLASLVPGHHPSESPLRTPTKSAHSGQAASYILSGSKQLVCPEILSIEELLDLPIPIFTKDSIQKSLYGGDYMPVGRSDYLFQTDRYDTDYYSKPGKSGYRSSREREEDLNKRSQVANFEDIMRGLTKKLISWNQLVFSGKTFEHLRQRPFLLE